MGEDRVMYAGWIPGNRRDQQKWRKLGMQGEMRWKSLEDGKRCYEKRGVFSYCDATPELMKQLLDEKLLPNPGSWTAYWISTDEQLPKRHQLWGGAPVQLCHS